MGCMGASQGMWRAWHDRANERVDLQCSISLNMLQCQVQVQVPCRQSSILKLKNTLLGSLYVLSCSR